MLNRSKNGYSFVVAKPLGCDFISQLYQVFIDYVHLDDDTSFYYRVDTYFDDVRHGKLEYNNGNNYKKGSMNMIFGIHNTKNDEFHVYINDCMYTIDHVMEDMKKFLDMEEHKFRISTVLELNVDDIDDNTEEKCKEFIKKTGLDKLVNLIKTNIDSEYVDLFDNVANQIFRDNTYVEKKTKNNNILFEYIDNDNWWNNTNSNCPCEFWYSTYIRQEAVSEPLFELHGIYKKNKQLTMNSVD